MTFVCNLLKHAYKIPIDTYRPPKVPDKYVSKHDEIKRLSFEFVIMSLILFLAILNNEYYLLYLRLVDLRSLYHRRLLRSSVFLFLLFDPSSFFLVASCHRDSMLRFDLICSGIIISFLLLFFVFVVVVVFCCGSALVAAVSLAVLFIF